VWQGVDGEGTTHLFAPSQDAEFLEGAIQKLGLSIRAWHRILRVSRTIADLAGQPAIGKEHLIEALSYRAMDRLLSRLRSS